MSWLLPPALLPIAGVLGIMLAWPRLRRPASIARLFVETLLVALAAIVGCAAVWALSWWIEQRR